MGDEPSNSRRKNVILEPDHAAFRRDLFSTAGVSEREWLNYWREMKLYRDKSVAHHDRKRSDIPVFPRYDLALESAYFYYACRRQLWLKEFGATAYFEPEDLKVYADAFAHQAATIAAVAVNATASIKEGVE